MRDREFSLTEIKNKDSYDADIVNEVINRTGRGPTRNY